jgi:cytochrome c5
MAKYIILILLLVAALIVSIAGIRGTTFRRPPLMLFDDMDDQPRYKSQSESVFFADGRSMRPVPAGAVPFGRPSWTPEPALVIEDPAAYKLPRNPLTIDKPLLLRGQQVYSTHCTVCHGGAGLGDGVITRYDAATPANLHSDRLRGVTDGYLYQVITEGKGLMGPYAQSIRPDDRWAAVAYLRALQRSQNAKLGDVPQAQREALERQK